MARREARVQASIWSDEDFKALPCSAQRLYLLLLSQPDLSYCGVLAYRPKRWTLMASDSTVRAIEVAVKELERTRFIVVDHDAGEVWVRTFIAHNKVLSSPNLIRAMAHDFTSIQSEPIRSALVEGLGEGFLEGLPERFDKGFPHKLPEGFVQAFPEGFLHVRIARSTHNPQPTTHNAAPPPPPAGFEVFWSAYPRSEGKLAAQKAWPKAVKAALGEVDDIIQGAVRFAADPNRTPEFTPHASTWLNAGRWMDTPLPPRTGRNGQVLVPANPNLEEWQQR